MKTFARRFCVGQWSFIGPGSEKKWYSSENSPQGAWDNIAEQMLLEFAESRHPIFRATTPLSRGSLKSKGRGKLSIHFAADQDTVDTIYRIILSVNQLSIYGAVAAVCEEFEDHRDRTGEPVMLMGQSIVLGEIKAEVPLQDQKIIIELSGSVQELQIEVNCMNDSKDFQDAESVRSGNSHVASQPMSFPKHPIPEGMLRPSFVSPRRKEGPPSIWDTHGISGNVFANPHASSSAPYPQELNPWGTTIEEPLHVSTAEQSERPEQSQDLRCQSGPSAKDSVIFSGGDSSKNYGADKQRLQISDLHFDKFPTPATFACWKIRFKTEVCTCSQFPTEAMQWIKEVELVDSVDELRSSLCIRGISMPNFEVLDARIASALNKIIHNSHFKRKISLEEQKAQKEDRFLRGRQIAHLIYDHFRVTGTDDSVENYTDLFTIALRNDDIQEFDSKWDGILLSMTKIPHDDILEGLYKLRIRESEKLRTVMELYDLKTHQKKLGPDYHRLKTMVKRCIEQEIRNKNFGARSGNSEKNAVVKNQGTKQRGQRILGDCWQWEANGQCVKGDNCSFRHDMDKRGKSSPSNPSQNSFMQQSERKPSRTRSPRGRSPSGRMSRWPCKDYFKGTCNNSSCKRWHPPECLFYKNKNGCRFGEKCSFAHRQVDTQPTKWSKSNNDKSAVALLKKGDWHERESVTDRYHDRSGKPDKRSDKKLGRNSSKRQSRNNHRYAVVVQDLATQWIQAYPCKNKTSQETQRSLQKFLEPERKPKVIYTDNSLEFGKACEDLSWNHCTSTPHRSETNGIAERAVRRVKEGTSAVLLQSGLNESWWADSMECKTYLRNVTDLLSDGKTPYERRFGKPFEGPIIPCGSLVEYHPTAAKDQSRIHQFGKKVLPELFLGYALYVGGIWKGDVLIADLEELETMDASEIYSKRLNAKEVIFPEQGEIIFPIADGRIKTPEGDGQEDGVPRQACNRRRRTREGPEPAGVQTTPLVSVVAHAKGEGRIDVLPWYRLVGVAKTSSETQRRKSRAARKGKWPPRGTGTTVLTYPRSAPRGTGKAGENGQNSAAGRQLTLDKTVGSRVW